MLVVGGFGEGMHTDTVSALGNGASAEMFVDRPQNTGVLLS